MTDEGLPGAPQVDVIVPTSDSIAGNIADDALIPVILGPTQVGTQRFDELRNQVIQGLATTGQLAAHTGDQAAHYTAAQIVTAIDGELGSMDWRTGGGGGGLQIVSHDGTLDGDGTAADPLGVDTNYLNRVGLSFAGTVMQLRRDGSGANAANIASALTDFVRDLGPYDQLTAAQKTSVRRGDMTAMTHGGLLNQLWLCWSPTLANTGADGRAPGEDNSGWRPVSGSIHDITSGSRHFEFGDIARTPLSHYLIISSGTLAYNDIVDPNSTIAIEFGIPANRVLPDPGAQTLGDVAKIVQNPNPLLPNVWGVGDPLSPARQAQLDSIAGILTRIAELTLEIGPNWQADPADGRFAVEEDEPTTAEVVGLTYYDNRYTWTAPNLARDYLVARLDLNADPTLYRFRFNDGSAIGITPADEIALNNQYRWYGFQLTTRAVNDTVELQKSMPGPTGRTTYAGITQAGETRVNTANFDNIPIAATDVETALNWIDDHIVSTGATFVRTGVVTYDSNNHLLTATTIGNHTPVLGDAVVLALPANIDDDTAALTLQISPGTVTHSLFGPDEFAVSADELKPNSFIVAMLLPDSVGTSRWFMIGPVNLTQDQVESDTSDAFGLVSGRRLAQAIDAHGGTGGVTPDQLEDWWGDFDTSLTGSSAGLQWAGETDDGTVKTARITPRSLANILTHFSDDDGFLVKAGNDDLAWKGIETDNSLSGSGVSGDVLGVDVHEVIELLQENIAYYHEQDSPQFSTRGSSIGHQYRTSPYTKTITHVTAAIDPPDTGVAHYVCRVYEVTNEGRIVAKLGDSNQIEISGSHYTGHRFTFPHDGVTIPPSTRVAIVISRTITGDNTATHVIFGPESSNSPRESYPDASNDFHEETWNEYDERDPQVGDDRHAHGSGTTYGDIWIYYSISYDHGRFVGDGNVDASHIDSGDADDGWVLTADGSGGADWEANPAGGDTTWQGTWSAGTYPAGAVVVRNGELWMADAQTSDTPWPSANNEWHQIDTNGHYRGDWVLNGYYRTGDFVTDGDGNVYLKTGNAGNQNLDSNTWTDLGRIADIEDWALEGNTQRIPESKVPGTLIDGIQYGNLQNGRATIRFDRVTTPNNRFNLPFWMGSQPAYDALATKEANVIYFTT